MAVSTEIQFLMSGAEADGLGGVISAARTAAQSASAISMSGITAVYAHDNAPGSGTLQFYPNGHAISEPDGTLNTSTADAIPAMTGNTSPNGIASAISELSASTAAWYAMNDIVDGGWVSGYESAAWLAYEFSSPKIINKYTVGVHTAVYATTDWTLEAWNGSEWDTLDTQSAQTGWGTDEVRTYAFANNTLYNKYRLNVTGVAGGSDKIYVGAFELIESQSSLIPADSLSWNASNDSAGIMVDVSSNGEYFLGSGTSGELAVSVVSASLPTSAESELVTISEKLNGIFDDISSSEALAGDVEYQCLYLKNTDTVTHTLKIWHSSIDTGGAAMSLGLDVAGVGDGSTTGVAATIADEGTAPAGVTFSSPVTEASGLAFVLQSGEAQAIWFRRSITAGPKAGYDDRCILRFSVI